ncbi:MAG TPA: hypothetical protein VFF52_02440, partial [Isosphaeraceae bacterium]|nr:hypothetical protein [Isosphaeraceae bacterium]
MHHQGVLGRIQVALEVGGGATILASVHGGFGVGIVSEAAVLEPTGLLLRPLDPNAFPRIEATLIGRRLGGSGDHWDLSEQAQTWCAVLRRIARSKRTREHLRASRPRPKTAR